MNAPTEIQRPSFGRRLLNGWYWLAAPPEVPLTANLEDREIVRRGRLGSVALLISFIETLIAIPITFIAPSLVFRIILIIFAFLGIFAFYLNRSRHIVMAGIICVLGTELSIWGTILTDPNGFTISGVENYFLIAQAILFAATLLPSVSVFIIALINCIAFNVVFQFMPHSPEIVQLLAKESYVFINRATTLQIVTAVIMFLWVRSARGALQRADRSDSIATLERSFAARDRAEKEQLQLEIQALVQDIVQVEKNPQAPLPLDPQKPFWSIYVALDNMRKRFIRLYQEAEQSRANLNQYMNALNQLTASLRQGTPWRATGTPVDAIAPYMLRQRDLPPGSPRSTSRYE